MYTDIWEDLRYSVDRMLEYPRRNIVIVHHDDADGLSSAAIIYESLKRAGIEGRTICIEKLIPQVIEYIHSTFESNAIFYLDIGSPHADKISRYNSGKNLVIILDHHDPKPSEDEYVININPEFYGYKGEFDASGSIMAYLFARAFNESNKDLSKIALIGAQELPRQDGYLVRLVYRDVESLGIDIDLKEYFKVLQILGSVGYYEDGPSLGIEACIDGLKEDILKRVRELEDRRKKANRRMLAILYRKGLAKGDYIQWFDSMNIYKGMGTKVIGTFCSYLSYQRRLIDINKYIIGIMSMPNEIPGLMVLKGRWLKISGRVPAKIKKLIEEGRYPGIADVMVAAAERVGGVGDGHQYAASVVIPADMKMSFLKYLDEEIGKRIK